MNLSRKDLIEAVVYMALLALALALAGAAGMPW